jgi:hypothetical protein
MAKNRRSLLDSCHEAFWSFPEDTLSSDRRIAAVLLTIAECPLADRTFLYQTARTILMADIAMCQGNECPVKEDCWRYMAPSNRFQSYIATPPYTEEGCEYFWDMNEK